MVVTLAVASLPCRGRLSAFETERKLMRERLEGKRRSGSRRAVQTCFRYLEHFLSGRRNVVIATDRKTSYAAILREELGARVIHVRHPSRATRNYHNPLFPINHTLAMMRDGLSRLVRRNWGASKRQSWLEWHAWVWVAYRNFIRSITNEAKTTSSAMALGLVDRMLDKYDLFTWRAGSQPE